jgi:hypothetical protein
MLGLMALLAPASASATWDGGKCELSANGHCYNLQSWEMEGGLVEAAPPDRFAEVQTPTGPALPLERILAVAGEEAERAGEPFPSFATGEGTLEQAEGTFNAGFTPPEGNVDPGYQRLLDTPVVVLMTGQHFTLSNARVRPGSTTPTVDAMFVVTDSHTGQITGRGLPTPDAVQQGESLTAVAAARRRVIALSPVTGTITGIFRVSGGPAKKRPSKHIPPATSHAVLVQRGGKTVKVAHTNGRGGFSVRVAPGTYSLKGTVGADCQPKAVRVQANKTVRVTLGCDIR